MQTKSKCEGYCPKCSIAKKPNFNWEMCVKVNTISFLHEISTAIESTSSEAIKDDLKDFEESINKGSVATPEKVSD